MWQQLQGLLASYPIFPPTMHAPIFRHVYRELNVEADEFSKVDVDITSWFYKHGEPSFPSASGSEAKRFKLESALQLGFYNHLRIFYDASFCESSKTGRAGI